MIDVMGSGRSRAVKMALILSRCPNSIARLTPRDVVELMAPTLSQHDLEDPDRDVGSVPG